MNLLNTQYCIKLNAPLDKNLSSHQRKILQAIKQILADAQLTILELNYDDLEGQLKLMHRFQGMLVLAFSQWEAKRLSRPDKRILSSEFVHTTSVIATATKKPLLILREKNVNQRGVLRPGYVSKAIDMPVGVDLDWFKGESFKRAFDGWVKQVKEHRHVFLAYSSKAKITAALIRGYVEDELKMSVIDWHDNNAGGTIMQNIQKAERLTMCGVFLFMEDDKIGTGKLRQDVPRDNVIFEAGFFAGAKGHEKTMIVRESNAKIPTDLGGVIYAELIDRSNIELIKKQLFGFMKSILTG